MWDAVVYLGVEWLVGWLGDWLIELRIRSTGSRESEAGATPYCRGLDMALCLIELVQW